MTRSDRWPALSSTNYKLVEEVGYVTDLFIEVMWLLKIVSYETYNATLAVSATREFELAIIANAKNPSVAALIATLAQP